jgi:competence protein ComEC
MMNRRPLVVIAVFFALGIVLGRYLQLRWVYLAAAIVMAVIAAVLYRSRVFWVVLAAAVCFAAFLSAGTVNIAYADTGDGLSVTGRVTSAPYQSASGSTVCLLDNASIDGSPCGGIKLYIDEGAGDFAPGDVIEAHADVDIPKGVRNPGGFDEKLYLLSQGIHYKAYADAATRIGRQNGFMTLFARVRGHISDTISMIFEDDIAPVATAMMLGDKSGLDADTYTAFKDTGMAHVLAVSGLHAGILIAFVYYILKAMKAPRTPRLIISLAFIAAYALLTGMTPSIVRAAIMASALLMGQYFGRQTDTLTYLAAAFIISLTMNPLDLFSAGFQLSFGAVFGILTVGWQVARGVKQKLPERFAKIGDAVGVSIGATAGTLPLLAMTFHRVSVFSFFTNLVILPLASAAIVLVFIAAIAGLVFGAAAAVIAIPAAAFIRIVLVIIHALAGASITAVNVASPPGYVVLAWFVLLFVVSKFFLIKIKRKVILCVAVCVAAAAAVWVMQPHGMIVTFLDVGQADAAFIRTAQGGEYLIDGGREQSAAEVSDFTIRSGYTPDAAFVSHTDDDHFSGIVALYDAGLLDKVYCSWQEADTVKTAMPKAQVVPLSAGDTVQLDEQTQALVLYPYRDTAEEERNENSLVLLVTYGAHRVLFTGDISGATETRIFAEMDKVDIYKASHHGSKYSSYRLPLSVLSPHYSVVSVGSNSFGHPHPWAMDNLRMYSDEVYTTHDDYAVVFTIDENITVKTYGE